MTRRELIGPAIVGVVAGLVGAFLDLQPDAWQWWAIMGACVVSGIVRKEIG